MEIREENIYCARSYIIKWYIAACYTNVINTSTKKITDGNVQSTVRKIKYHFHD